MPVAQPASAHSGQPDDGTLEQLTEQARPLKPAALQGKDPDGNTQAPEITGEERLDHWRFEEGPQILDVPEEVAIQRIRETVAKLQGQ
jgi:hypothetical protein